MAAALNSEAGKAELKRYSLNPIDIGVHSIRKGGSTYAASGSTNGPSFASICLRAGWAIGSVQERYIKLEGAGDQFVGRTIRGVPLDSAKFAQLPPHFKDGTLLDDDINSCYPSLIDLTNLNGSLRNSLASVVHHSNFLQASLRKNHPVMSTAIFSRIGLLDKLKAGIIYDTHSPEMTSTGIPPYCSILKEIDELKDKVENLPAAIVGGVEDVLERNGAAAANVTPGALKATIEAVLLTALATHLPNLPIGNVPVPPIQAPSPEYSLFNWGGKFHRVPEDFDFPQCNAPLAFQLWFLGNPNNKIPPYRMLEPSDMSTLKKRKRLSDWTYLMKALVQQLGADSELDSPQLDERIIRSQFILGRDRLPTVNKKKRGRPEDWKVTTAVRETRAAFKIQKTTEAADVGEAIAAVDANTMDSDE